MTSPRMTLGNSRPIRTPRPRAGRRTGGGGAFTLIEMMMAMTIVAALLAAVGAAMDSSMNSYGENEKFCSATQIGRSIVGRMTREARTCADLDSASDTLIITPPPSTDPDDPTQITYRLVLGRLIRHVKTQGTESIETLLGGDDDTSVDTFVVLREDDAAGLPVSITVRLILGVRDRTFAVTSSAALRTGQFR